MALSTKPLDPNLVKASIRERLLGKALLRSTILPFVFCSPTRVTLVKSFNSLNCMNRILFFLEGETKKRNFFGGDCTFFSAVNERGCRSRRRMETNVLIVILVWTQEMEALLFWLWLAIFLVFFYVHGKCVWIVWQPSIDSRESLTLIYLISVLNEKP